MQRTIDDYDSMTKREMIKAKQEKAQMYVHTVFPVQGSVLISSANRRVQKFRTDYAELRGQFDKLKGENASAVSGNHLVVVSVNLPNKLDCRSRNPIAQSLYLQRRPLPYHPLTRDDGSSTHQVPQRYIQLCGRRAKWCRNRRFVDPHHSQGWEAENSAL
jgi:Golgi SNAP receptor complex protein 2